jgi:hypothetical protein
MMRTTVLLAQRDRRSCLVACYHWTNMGISSLLHLRIPFCRTTGNHHTNTHSPSQQDTLVGSPRLSVFYPKGVFSEKATLSPKGCPND